MVDVNSFKKGMEFIAYWEWANRKDGGYTNDRSDPGGETKWGISKRAHPELDIKNLTPEQALEIYGRDYWDRCMCDSIPFPYNVAVFDTAVNCGVSRALAWFKEAGSCEDFLDMRKRHYVNIVTKNPALSRFIKGWFARLLDLMKYVEVNSQPTQ